MSPTITFRTLGCKQNQFDTHSLRIRLAEGGFAEAGHLDEADWILLNTCAVTDRAMAKARGEVNRLRRRNPSAKVVVMGCGIRYQPENFPNVECRGVLPREFGIDRWIGEDNGAFIGSELCPPHGVFPADRSRALLRIQNGCNQQCAFCIVPHLRGPSRSVSSEACLQALRDLVDQGVPEVVLTGTNIALWGKDLPGSPSLIDLLKDLVVGIGTARLRLSSLEPQLISPEFIEWCVIQPQICRHFHLAVQSGSPRILGLMARGKPVPGFFDYLADLKKEHQDVAIGADVMAGFPGETAGDYSQTLNLIKSIPFSYLHVFPYSERLGTAAVELSNKVLVNERLRRAKTLRQLDTKLRERFAAENSGKLQDIVTIANSRAGKTEGLTSNYLRVTFADGYTPPGRRFRSGVSAAQSTIYVQ